MDNNSDINMHSIILSGNIGNKKEMNDEFGKRL